MRATHVAFDQRGEGTWWPSWLREQGFTRTGTTVGRRDFQRNAEIVDGGRPRVSGGGATRSRARAGWGDQVIEVKVRQIQVGASVMFRAPDRADGYLWNIGGPLGSEGGLGQLRMSTVVNGRSTLLGSVVPIEPAAGNEYTLRIEAVGDRLRTFVVRARPARSAPRPAPPVTAAFAKHDPASPGCRHHAGYERDH